MSTGGDFIMQVLQGMDPDKMIIILPSALIAMYLIISLQKRLCGGSNPHIGLILPAICFAASTVLAVRPVIVTAEEISGGLILLCLRMWLNSTSRRWCSCFLIICASERCALKQFQKSLPLTDTAKPAFFYLF